MARGKLTPMEEFRRLRAQGKTRADEFETDAAAEDLFVTVDENEHREHIRKRMRDNEDFIVDDNGAGYVDDGRDESDQHYSSEEEEVPVHSKAGKRKREEEQREREAQGIKKIGNYFKKPAEAPPAQKKAKPVATAEDAAFMADLLGEMDANIPSKAPLRQAEKRRDVRPRGRRDPTPPRPRQVYRPVHRSFEEAFEDTQGTSQTLSAHEDDGIAPIMDDDVLMSDPMPSSPIAHAVARKNEPIIKAEEEDEDLMEVAQVTGVAATGLAVNKMGSRPMPKLKKTDYPTPESSSPTRPPTAAVDASTWNAVTDRLNVLSSPPTETTSVGKLASSACLEEDGSLRMFWIDYTEVNGSLCLFGKVKDKTTNTYASCFVKIDNILRKLFFLPREHKQRKGRDTTEEVGLEDVYQEVDSVMSKLKVNMHKIKDCSRRYAFELPDIPKEADYMKLFYPYDKPMLPQELMSGETYSHVFGTNTALFEQFVLWKNIMGPCWLRIEGADFQGVSNASWCKLEALVNKPSGITTLGESDNLEAPPLTLMSIALRTTYNAKENKQEILMASARIYENVSLTDTTPPEAMPCKAFTVMRPNGKDYPPGFKIDAAKHNGRLDLERDERGLLSKFMAIMQKMDPDVLMGHRLDDVDYPVLLNRMRERKTPGWHRIGRLRRSDWPKNMGKGGASFIAERQLAAGRLHCDLANDMGKSLMTKCQSWSLNEMVDLVLSARPKRMELDNEQALKTWAAEREGLLNYVKHCEADTFFVAAISLRVQMLPLTKVLTNLAGNSWARTLSGTRAERNEYILLHEFHRNKYICPDKIWGKGPKAKEVEELGEDGEPVDAKKKDKFKGGLVFEPEKGLYDKFILVMDFNSLYPSIIQEFNICFTTVERADISEDDEKVPEVPAEQTLGILPKLIATLVNRRREVKKLMKDKSATSDQLATWDIKQLALKLTANSMYGCLGYTRSRFYARPLAMLTTYKGREILRSTKDLADSTSLRVIYGDTDSLFLNTNMDNMQDALKLGTEFKKSVNERYKLLEIDIDNVFRRILLHAKKKYAAVNMVEVDGKWTEKLEVKGLDMRRREYCALSKETSSKLLNFLLSGDEQDVVVEHIHDYLRQLAQRMREFEEPVHKYTIFQQLGKDPKDYPNAKSMASVQVALRQMAKGKHVKAKDVMSFIITGESSGSAEKAASNAFPLDEVLKQESGLKPDIDYYLHKQILPPVERLCAPISGTNITRLAECLGLDTSKYRMSSASGNGANQEAEIMPLESQIPDEIRYKDSKPLSLRCNTCHKYFAYKGLGILPDVVSHDGFKCPHTSCSASLASLSVVSQLEAQIRQHTARYYAGWLVCDDPSCGARTRQMSVYGHRCLRPKGLGHGCLGRMNYEYTERMMYNQLMYLQSLFDVEKCKERASKENGTEKEASEKVRVLAELNRERFETAQGVVKGYLERNGRQWVAMDSLFGFALKAI